MEEGIVLDNPELVMLINNKEDGWQYRQRRHLDWDENYELYRDKVRTNRITQRQSVNLPVMKQTIRTLLKDVDDMPVLYYENLDNDKDAEIFKNAYWENVVDINKMELQDIVDKRQVFLFGRTFDSWQVVNGRIKFTIEDPMDLYVSRFMNPFDIHSSRFLIHTHIFRPLSALSNNPRYDQEAVRRLQEFYATQMGLIKAQENHATLMERNEKLSSMGVADVNSPILGETYVELTNHFVFREDKEHGDEQIYLYVECDDREILMKSPLEDIIDPNRRCKDRYWRDHYPYDTWADDLERQDFWSDGVADIVRTPNKVANAWFSQLIENRTMKNFNMNIFNSSLEGFNPQTWQAMAWGMYGVPLGQDGKLSEVFQQLPVQDLTDSLEEMNFVLTMLEKATGATSTQQGVQTQRQVTLGEVQLALGEAKERIKGMSKFYTPAWKERGTTFLKLIEAAGDQLDAVTLYKKGKITNDNYAREVTSSDWETETGYGCKVWSQDEKQANDTESLNKLNAVKANMPDNPTVNDKYQRKLLEFAGFKPDEVNSAMQFEEAKQQAMASMTQGGMIPAGTPTSGAPAQPALPQAPQQIPAVATAGQ